MQDTHTDYALACAPRADFGRFLGALHLTICVELREASKASRAFSIEVPGTSLRSSPIEEIEGFLGAAEERERLVCRLLARVGCEPRLKEEGRLAVIEGHTVHMFRVGRGPRRVDSRA